MFSNWSHYSAFLIYEKNLFSGEVDGSLKVRTLKTALAVLCSGKLMDKLRYIFSLLADNHGHLIHEKYAAFVQDVSCVPQGKLRCFRVM